MNKLKTFFLLIIPFLFIASCNINNTIPITNALESKQSKSNTIVGKIKFPESIKEALNKPRFTTKGTLEKVSKKATVSLLYAYNEGSNANKTITSGLSDENGNFILNFDPYFLPSTSARYLLQATKRIGNQIVTAQTFLRWNDTTKAWESITAPSIEINSYTTALTIMSALNNISISRSINTVVLDGTETLVNNIMSSDGLSVLLTKNQIFQVSDMVVSLVDRGKDPYAFIKKVNGVFQVDAGTSLSDLGYNNSCIGCDLSTLNSTQLANTEFAGKDLSYSNLSGLDLSNKDLSGTILVGANLKGTNLPQDLSYLNLSQTNLTGQNLSSKNLTGTNLSYANLTDVIFSKGSVINDLSKTRLTGADLSYADLTNTSLKKVNLFETTLFGTKIQDANFTDADMMGVDLSAIDGLDFTGTNFTRTNLQGASFFGHIIDETNPLNLSTANITEANFTRAFISKKLNDNMSGCNFTAATIIGAGSNAPIDYSKASFERAVIQNVNFNNVNCSNCNFSQANFKNVSFNNVNLESADFSFSDMDSVFSINNSNMRKVNFDGVDSHSNSGSLLNNDISYASFRNSDLSNYVISVTKADYANFTKSSIYSFDIVNIEKEHIYSRTYGEATGHRPISFNYYSINDYYEKYKFSPFLFSISVSNSSPNGSAQQDVEDNQSESYLESKYDDAPNTVIKDINFTDAYATRIKGYFLNANFTNFNKNNPQTTFFEGYYKNCTFDMPLVGAQLNDGGAIFRNFYNAIIVDSTFTSDSYFNFHGCYIKGTEVYMSDPDGDFSNINPYTLAINSTINMSEGYKYRGFIKSSTINIHPLTTNQTPPRCASSFSSSIQESSSSIVYKFEYCS